MKMKSIIVACVIILFAYVLISFFLVNRVEVGDPVIVEAFLGDKSFYGPGIIDVIGEVSIASHIFVKFPNVTAENVEKTKFNIQIIRPWLFNRVIGSIYEYTYDPLRLKIVGKYDDNKDNYVYGKKTADFCIKKFWIPMIFTDSHLIRSKKIHYSITKIVLSEPWLNVGYSCPKDVVSCFGGHCPAIFYIKGMSSGGASNTKLTVNTDDGVEYILRTQGGVVHPATHDYFLFFLEY